jgi:hypothetical protein
VTYLTALIVLVILGWLVFRRPTPLDSAKNSVGERPDPRPIGETYPSAGFPISADGPSGPVPGERPLPDFQWPNIISVDMPPVPECGLTYPLVYTDVVQVLTGCHDVEWIMPRMQRDLLTRAREQAAVYCYRHQDNNCRGVEEVGHSFHHQCFQADGETFVGVTITYFFKCGEPAADTGTAPPPVTEVPIPQGEPNCTSTYHFVAHSVSQILNDCASPDRPAIEQRKGVELLQAARDHAATFCGGARQETCRIPVEISHDLKHHCFRSEGENSFFHTSTVIYFFQCPPTA